MRKILLINPPLYFSNGIPYAIDVTVPPLGILYIASYINSYSGDIKAELIDVAANRMSLNQIKNYVNDVDPFVIGISSMTAQLQGAVELAKFLKNNVSQKIKIFLGGPHVSADKDFVCRHNDIFDYAITGEGEKTFLDSVVKITKGEIIPRIQSGEIVMNLDELPFPDKKIIDREKYGKRESVMFSRGCPYLCYYCSRPAISSKVRYRSVANMVEEIESVYVYCNGKIDFQDDTLTMNKKYVLEFCREVNRKGLKLDWQCNTRIDLVDEELLCAMKKAGCSLVHFGIESGNERIRESVVHKGDFTNEQIYRVFKICKKYKIKIAGYFMIGHPNETEADINDTKSMILNSGIDLLGLSIPTPFPGSKLYDIAKEKGVINENIIDQFADKKLGEGYAGNYPVYISENFKKKYVFSVMKEINRSFYINFKMFWSRLEQDIISFSRLKKDVKELLSLVVKGVSTKKPYVKT